MLAHSLLCAKQITLAMPKLGMQDGFTELHPLFILNWCIPTVEWELTAWFLSSSFLFQMKETDLERHSCEILGV